MVRNMISIIIPVYNGEKYIESCINSILSQTYREYEIILIDDGSIDNSLEVAHNLADNIESMHVIHTENYGVSHARNVGLDNVKGEYITFVDVDDQLTEDALESLYNLVDTNIAEIAIMSKKYLTEGGQDIGVRQYDESIEVWENIEILKKSLEDHPASHSVYAKLYRRDLIETIRFVEGRKIHEDSFFVFECFAKCKRAVYCNKAIYNYYEITGSASRAGFADKYLDILYFAEEKCRIIDNTFVEHGKYKCDIMVRAYLALLYNLCKTYDRKYRKLERKCIFEMKKYMKQFKPVYEHEKKMLKIIQYKLFPVYKFYVYLRMNKVL